MGIAIMYQYCVIILQYGMYICLLQNLYSLNFLMFHWSHLLDLANQCNQRSKNFEECFSQEKIYFFNSNNLRPHVMR